MTQPCIEATLVHSNIKCSSSCPVPQILENIAHRRSDRLLVMNVGRLLVRTHWSGRQEDILDLVLVVGHCWSMCPFFILLLLQKKALYALVVKS